MNRRQLLKISLIAGTALASAQALIACTSVAPSPFKTGQITGKPKGCKDLLSRNRQGDC